MRKKFLSAVLGIAAATAAALVIDMPRAQAQEYPNKSVKMVVGFPPGNTTDIVARVLAEGLRARLGQPFLVVNQTGASGMIGAEAVARSAPDGYTILVSNTGSIVVSPILHPNKYDIEKDFIPITTTVMQPLVAVVNPNNPRTAGIKTLQDLVAMAKAKPGSVTYGSGGIGNMLHIAAEQLAALVGIEMIHVPYRGGAPMQAALLGGSELDFGFDTLTTIPHIKSGKLRALAVTGPTRWPDLPDVPAMSSELGVPLNISIWTGILVPAGTPDKIVQLLHREILAVMQDPRYKDTLAKQGAITPKTPQAFREQIRTELQQNAALVKRLNIKVE